MSPAALADLKEGDLVTAVDGMSVNNNFNLDEAMDNKIGSVFPLPLRRPVVVFQKRLF